MRDDERGIDLAALDAFEQWAQVAMHVRLAHLEGQTLAEGRAERQLVEEAAIDAGHGDRATFATSVDRLPKRVRAICGQKERGFRAIIERVNGRAVRFETDGINARI